jgi:hypothetical protein
MLTPSVFALSVAALMIAVLAATDWYIWGLNLANNPRQPRNPQPLSGVELVDLGLGRLIAANRAVLPKAAFETAHANSSIAIDPDDGFKRVA